MRTHSAFDITKEGSFAAVQSYECFFQKFWEPKKEKDSVRFFNESSRRVQVCTLD